MSELIDQVERRWAEDRARAETLVDAVAYAYGMAVLGDVIEFGVLSGRTATLLGAAMSAQQRRGNPARRLWLCDSFVGFPKSDAAPDAGSPHVQSGIWGPGTNRGASAADVGRQVAEVIEDYRIIEGWFRTTAPEFAAPGQCYAVIHADCDLYQSTMDALLPLFRQRCVAPGAMILFDDWNCNRASPEFGQRRAWAALVAELGIECSDEGAYSIASHKFIVHGYRG